MRFVSRLICFPKATGVSWPVRSNHQEIQKWIWRQHGFVPESAWLLHCKEQFGLVAPGTAPIENPYLEKVAAIQEAFGRFGVKRS
jgi:hypothetical protein